MKRIPFLFLLFALYSLARADTNSYGAWWGIADRSDAATGAGALFILFEGDVTSLSSTGGLMAVTMVYNISGESYTIPGHYTRRVGNVVHFEAAPEPLTFFSPPAWKGRLNLLSGQCNGTWHNPGLQGPAPGGGYYIARAVRGRFVSNIRPPHP